MATVQYTDSTKLTARLGRVTGLTVPSDPAVIADLIDEASTLIEDYIGYAWIHQTGVVDNISVSRSGQGKLLKTDAVFCPLTNLSNVQIPTNSIYFGYTVAVNDLEWDAHGNVNLIALPVKHVWRSPILNLSDYPGELIITYDYGPQTPYPDMFTKVCHELCTILLLRDDDPDQYTSKQVKIQEMNLKTDLTYRDDALGKALEKLWRYKR